MSFSIRYNVRGRGGGATAISWILRRIAACSTSYRRRFGVLLPFLYTFRHLREVGTMYSYLKTQLQLFRAMPNAKTLLGREVSFTARKSPSKDTVTYYVEGGVSPVESDLRTIYYGSYFSVCCSATYRIREKYEKPMRLHSLSALIAKACCAHNIIPLNAIQFAYGENCNLKFIRLEEKQH